MKKSQSYERAREEAARHYRGIIEDRDKTIQGLMNSCTILQKELRDMDAELQRAREENAKLRELLKMEPADILKLLAAADALEATKMLLATKR